jgi:hypothetical protein
MVDPCRVGVWWVMFERFTERARRVLVLAQEEARLLNHNFIGTEHILLGLIHEGDGVAARALGSLGISLEAVRVEVEETVGPAGSSRTGSPPFTPRAKKVLELSLREALQLGHQYIGTEHILLGLVREGEGVAVQVLVGLGADLSRVRQQVLLLLSGLPPGGGGAEESVTAAVRPVRSGAPGPRCPNCAEPLEGQVAYRILTVVPVEPDLGPMRVAFVYCGHCGFTIERSPYEFESPLDSPTAPSSSPGARSASGDPGHPLVTVSPLLPPRSATIREFPDDLWTATAPASVPTGSAVDVRHSGRFRADGNIHGTVGEATVDLAVELPRGTSSATGTLGDAPVNVTWNLSYNSRSGQDLPATLQGTVGEQTVNLQGFFQLGAGYRFDRASVGGTLADEDLAVSIEPASTAFENSDTIVATGTLAEHHFEIFVSLKGSLERGLVRGTYDGQDVHLDLTAIPGSDAHVAGTCPSPPPFTLLVVASLLYFV